MIGDAPALFSGIVGALFVGISFCTLFTKTKPLSLSSPCETASKYDRRSLASFKYHPGALTTLITTFSRASLF